MAWAMVPHPTNPTRACRGDSSPPPPPLGTARCGGSGRRGRLAGAGAKAEARIQAKAVATETKSSEAIGMVFGMVFGWGGMDRGGK